MKKVYYADKVIIFTSDYQTSEGKTLFDRTGEVPGIERILKALDDSRRLTLWSPDANRVFDGFCALFTPVEAAGGAVFCDDKVLMIKRRGFWDLPKGHLEPDETLRECALREVSEECGLASSCIDVGTEIARTLHFYWYEPAARWEMKRTTWYKMRYNGAPACVEPQRDEDITSVEWMTLPQATRATSASYMTIQDVIAQIKD